MARKRMKPVKVVMALVLMMSVSLAVMAAMRGQSVDTVALSARHDAELVEPTPDTY